ncbi:MAG TPA: YihY/virulence factor BrkB family protein [Noviherbaspirillum sp.]|nr:YihY/virulence factor BrkB family protein [Noviherbaspirillum sp.]
MEIPGLRGLGPFQLIKESIADFLDDDMLTHASALAFQALFSIFPFIIFLIALLGFLQLTSFFEWLQSHAVMMLPAEAAKPVTEVIAGLQQQQGGLLSFGVIFALWTASAAVRVVMNATNAAYDVREARPAWKLYPLSIIYTIGIAAMLILSAVLMVLGPQAMEWIGNQVGFGDTFVTVWTWLRWPAAFLLLILATAIIYYVCPNVEQEFRFITPGAMIAVVVWILASVGFNFYVANFADYNAMYGSIGAIIVLLFYLFISSAVLLFGAEVNAVIEHHAPSGKDKGQKRAD